MSDGQKSQEARERIVQAALGLFCRRGYAAVGTQDICSAAGVLKGSLYHYFPSKMDIALAALRHYGETVRRGIEEAAAAEGPATARLLRLFEAAREQAVKDREQTGVVRGCLHGNLALELSALDPRARQVLDEVAQSWNEAMAPLLEELVKTKAVPPTKDLRAAGKAVLAYLHGVVLMAKTANDPDVISALGHRVFMLLGG